MTPRDDDLRDDPYRAPASASRGPSSPDPPGADLRRARLLAASSMAFPVLLVGCVDASWLSAWWELGHPPRPSIDDPADIGGPVVAIRWAALVLMLVFPLAVAGSLVGYLASLVIQARWMRRNLLLVLGPPTSWVAAYLLLRHDPGLVFVWFMD